MTPTAFNPGCMNKILPVGEYGTAKIVHDRPDSFTKLRAAMHGQPLDVYTRLFISGELWMTDADFEWATNCVPVGRMTGDVLIAGLGIGFILSPILRYSHVNSVTVIEKSADVIALVAPHFAGPKLTVIEADAYEWNAPKRSFDCCYLDIWADVPNADNWPDIQKLKRKYRPALRPKGWIVAWCEDHARKGGR